VGTFPLRWLARFPANRYPSREHLFRISFLAESGAVLGFIYVFIFVIGAVLGAVLRFTVFLRATLFVAACMVILGALRPHGLYPILMTFVTAIMFVILMLAGAAIGRTPKQAFLEG